MVAAAAVLGGNTRSKEEALPSRAGSGGAAERAVLFPRADNDEEDEEEAHAPWRGMSLDVGRGCLCSMRVSRAYLVYCVLCVFLSLGVTFALAFRDWACPPPWPIVALDALLVGLFSMEVLVEGLALRRHFFTNWWCVGDLAVLVTSVLGFLLLLIEALEKLPTEDPILVLCFTVARYVAQTLRALRFLWFAKDSRQSRHVIEGSDVHFAALKSFAESGL